MHDWTKRLHKRLAGLRLDPAREAEIVEELAQHLDERYRELRERGLDDAAASEAVSQELRDGDILAANLFVPSVRSAISRIDRAQLVSVRDVMTLDAIGHEATARYRFRARLVAAFASLALLLASVGLFGVLAYSVQGRWREYAVRMALGAKGSDVVTLIASGAARLVVPGVVIGAALSLAMGQWLSAMLFGVRPFDPTTLATVLAVLTLTVIAAVLAPALRATHVNAAGVLRGD